MNSKPLQVVLKHMWLNEMEGIEGVTHTDTKDAWNTQSTVKCTLDRHEPEGKLLEIKDRNKQVKHLKMLRFKDQRKAEGEMCDTKERGHLTRTIANPGAK